MRKKSFLAIVPLICIVLYGCSESQIILGPKREAISYSEEVIKVEYPLQLEVSIGFGNIEIYTWDKDELKLETASKIRGVNSEEKLKEGLKDFKLAVSTQENIVQIKSDYKGPIKSPVDRSFDLKIYMPRNAGVVNLMLDTGKIKIIDDIKCELNARVNMANIDINRIEGILKVEADMCDLRVWNGLLSSGSSAKVNFGHIRVKARFDEAGEYDFETGSGNVELNLPEHSNIYLESIGTLDMGGFENSENGSRIKAYTGMGNVTISKY